MNNKKFRIIPLILPLLLFVTVLFIPNKTYAAEVKNIITKLDNLTYEGQSETNCIGIFVPTFIYGSECGANGKLCGLAVKRFKCIDHGKYCPAEGRIKNFKVETISDEDVNKWKDHDGEKNFSKGHPNHTLYDYYKVTLFAKNPDDFQDVQGIVYKKKERTLTVKSVDTNLNSLAKVTGLSDRVYTVDYGSSVTPSHANSSTGYNFKEWRNSDWGYLAGNTSTYNITSLTKDTVIYAVYNSVTTGSGLKINVRNNDVSKYSSYAKTVYAKPEDTLAYHTDYASEAQASYNLVPQRVSIDGGSAQGGNNTTYTLERLFNIYRPSGLGPWSNAFTVKSTNFVQNSYNMVHRYTVGRKEAGSDDNSHKVNVREVGKELIEEAAMLRNSSGTSPSKVQIGLSDGVSVGYVSTNLKDSARAYIPYNFENKPHKPRKTNPDPADTPSDDDSDDDVNDDTSDKIVYSGERGTFDFAVDVNPRYNPETDGNYATVVDQAKWRLGLCIGSSECNNENYHYSQEYGGGLNDKLNASYKLEGESGIPLSNLEINIPDLAAGSRICVVAEVWPADSGAFTNWQVSGYTDRWERSPRACYTIAKRPAVQVWGGNIFTRGNIDTTPSVKNNLYGYSQYQYNANVKNGSSGPFVFGSWGELGVVSNGIIKGFGSGASMGYASNDGGLSPNPFLINTAASAPDPGGGSAKKFCDRIPLTIPNYPCSGGVTGSGLSSAVGITKIASDKQSIIDLLATGKDVPNRTHNPAGGIVDRGVVGEGIDAGAVRVISGDDNIVIGSDLIYLDVSGEYSNYNQIPKLIIYSKKNIYINCEVNRIDALLIANDTVVTCNNFDDTLTNENVENHINDVENSSQLVINGAVIAKRLIPNRTYGAATGANSIVPAEIINFDPTLYQFGNSSEEDENNTDGRLDVTYMHELPPRL